MGGGVTKFATNQEISYFQLRIGFRNDGRDAGSPASRTTDLLIQLAPHSRTKLLEERVRLRALSFKLLARFSFTGALRKGVQ